MRRPRFPVFLGGALVTMTLFAGCHGSGSTHRSTGGATTVQTTTATNGKASMTPDALRQKMVTSARTVVMQTGLKPTRAFLLFESCNDDGTGPYRALVSSGFTGSTIDLAESEKQVDAWVSTLTTHGWARSDATTGTNGRYLSHDGLTVALFPHQEPQRSPSPTFTLTSGCLLGDAATSEPEFKTGVDVLGEIT